MEFEHRQVVNRALEDFFQPPAARGFFVRTTFSAEDGFEPWHIQQLPSAINEALIEFLHFSPALKEQIAAVLHLIAAIRVTELRALLFFSVQAKA